MKRAGLLLWFVASVSALTSPASAQLPRDTAIAIARLHTELSALDSLFEREVWPGYHFSRLGLLYVIPGRAKVAASWPGEAPAGLVPLEGFVNIRWTDTSTIRWRGGLPLATLAVSASQSRAAVAGLALHEAFHAFEVTQRREGRRFGQGENTLVTASYPIFDVESEAAVLVENQLLLSAVVARTNAEARRHAQQFLAVRERRQGRLDTTFVNFEKAAELHEGLAQYTLLRGLDVLAKRNGSYRSGANEERRLEQDFLGNTLAGTNLSVRRRAYATGSHLALLLDRLAGREWKQRVVRDDMWLQDVLAAAIGRAAVAGTTDARIRAAAADASLAIARLRARREHQRDSVLAGAPMTLSIDPAAIGGRFDWCGFDPQNLLATGSGQLMHMRFVSLCRSGKSFATVSQPAIEDQLTGRVLTAVDPSSIQLSVDGKPSELPGVGESISAVNMTFNTRNIEIDLPKAMLARGEKTLLLIPLK
jgi:hypothetical protein